MKSVIWRSEQGRERLVGWYERFQAKIESPVERVTLPTSWGPSHVLVSGPDDGTPLVCLHAMRTGASFLLSELQPLLTRFRVYAPDLPGQSVQGLDLRLPVDDLSYSDWLYEVLDALQLSTVSLFGVSWGGFVALLAASSQPQRVQRLGLLVPAGIANGDHLKNLSTMLLPMIRYRLWPTESGLRRLLEPIVTTWDEDWCGFIACAMDDMRMDPRIPPLASDEQLKRLSMPTLVLAADQDLSFPGDRVAKRLKPFVSDLDVQILTNCKHCPPTTPEFRRWLGQRLTGFFDPHGAGAEPSILGDSMT
ncbi:alpha/beta fold hydrolase [Roseiconus nitratireducens]|nr:alpha/beta hydrolase [Roseiconus nitratireducens]